MKLLGPKEVGHNMFGPKVAQVAMGRVRAALCGARPTRSKSNTSGDRECESDIMWRAHELARPRLMCLRHGSPGLAQTN